MKLVILSIISVFLSHLVCAQSLERKIKHLAKGVDATIGLAVCELGASSVTTINGNEQFPMQSVYKLPISMALLDRVCKGELSLTDSVFVTKEMLKPGTWSPFRDKYPSGDLWVSMSQLIDYTVRLSDNNTSDIILLQLGGASVVDSYLRSISIDGVRVVSTEAELQQNRELMYKNWATPIQMIKLLDKYHKGEILDSPTREFLWNVAASTMTSSTRKRLPQGTVVAHKSGYSGVSDEGIIGANNDAGIMILPSGKRVAYALFISNTTCSSEESYDLLSRIIEQIYNHYNQQ